MSFLFGLGFVIASLAAILAAVRAPRRIALPFKVVPVAMLIASVAPLAGNGRLATGVLIALALSLGGDVAIAFSFVAGLGCFLFAHVAYVAALGLSSANPAAQALAGLPAAVVFAGMLAVLWSRVGKLRVAVVVYTVVICSMLARATTRALVTDPSASATLFLVGAALFVLSDALIAMDRFVRPIPHAQAVILATYYAAQALIAASCTDLWRSCGESH